MQLLAYRLECGPLQPRRFERWQTDSREAIVPTEIRNVWQRDLPSPEITGKGLMRRQPGLGEPAIPLGPDGRLAVAEVERFNDSPALPSVVGGVWRLVEDVATAGDVPEPRPGDRSRLDVQRYTAPGDSKPAMTRDTRR